MAIFDKLQHIGYFFHSVLFTEFDFLFRIFEFSFSQYVAIVKNSNFQMVWSLEQGNSRKMRIQKFWVKNQTQWTKLSGKNSQYVAICQKWPFPDFLESGIWKFQQNENSNILRKKPSLGTHTEWEKYLICCNLSKTAISRGFPDFLESGIRKSGNSGSHQKCPKLTYKWPWFLFF